MMSQQPSQQPPHQGNPLNHNLQQPINMQHAINAVMHAAALSHNGGIPNGAPPLLSLAAHHHGNPHHPLFPPPHPPSVVPPPQVVANHGNHGNSQNVAKQPVRPSTADHTTTQLNGLYLYYFYLDIN